jgi:4-carboxymuconolactone decarboxylase
MSAAGGVRQAVGAAWPGKRRLTPHPHQAVYFAVDSLRMVHAMTRSKAVTGARASIGGVAPKLADLTEDILFGDIWERPQLSKRDRSLITCAALVATGKTEQMSFHFPRAVENGVTQEELIEMITHLAFYVGWPSAMSAVTKAKELFGKQGS